jgi:hypothetical protein
MRETRIWEELGLKTGNFSQYKRRLEIADEI